MKDLSKMLRICEELIEEKLVLRNKFLKNLGLKDGDRLVLNENLFKDIIIPIEYKDIIFKSPYIKGFGYLIVKQNTNHKYLEIPWKFV